VRAQSVSPEGAQVEKEYTGEKRVFIVVGIDAMLLRCAPPGRTGAPVLLIFSSFH
jgi:hypothetical protein